MFKVMPTLKKFNLFIFIATILISSAYGFCNYSQPFFPYYSQIGQDKFLNESIFKNKKNGVFVDIGAHDGISYSNSFYFEKELNWQGICVEPNPFVYELLAVNRKCETVNACIYDKNGFVNFLLVNGPSEMLSGIYEEYDLRHLKRIDHEVKELGGSLEIKKIQSYTLNSLLAKHKLTNIDFLSIDTEGSEWTILKDLDFDRFLIKIICLENNYEDKKLHNLLINKGFKLIHRISTDYFYQNLKIHDL